MSSGNAITLFRNIDLVLKQDRVAGLQDLIDPKKRHVFRRQTEVCAQYFDCFQNVADDASETEFCQFAKFNGFDYVAQETVDIGLQAAFRE